MEIAVAQKGIERKRIERKHIERKHIEWTRHMEALKPVPVNLALICAGCLLCVIGMNAVIIPYNFLTGGLVGLAILIHYLFSWVEIGWTYLLLNIPLAILGWRHISRRFMAYTVFGTIFFSLAAAHLHPTVPDIKDPMLAALLAGVINGVGCGLILRSVGSAGGLDILVIYLNRRMGLRMGYVIIAMNSMILLAGAYFYDLEMLLYSIICLYASGRIADAIITGFNKRKSLMIITDRADEVARAILSDKGRGVTFLKGEGAFSGKDKNVIFTITSLTELSKLKALVLNIDPKAFIVVNDTLEVLGTRHGMGRVY